MPPRAAGYELGSRKCVGVIPQIGAQGCHFHTLGMGQFLLQKVIVYHSTPR